ncbi:type II secretion system F family protein [Desulfonispora thiosulfatigenes]|nr:type II secretion system F family protein [Desulfonispora thiosulfatigenes]
MLNFNYKARDKYGNLTRGTIKGNDKNNAVLQLQKLELFIIEIKNVKGTFSFRNLNVNLNFLNSEQLKLKELEVFCRQLAFLLSSGIPILKALEIIINNKTSKRIHKFTKNLINHLHLGLSLGDACALESKKVPLIMTNLITAGEVGGFLDVSLERLADHFEKEIKTRNTIKTALTYPIIIFLISILALNIIFIFVIPIFANILGNIDANLPLGTILVLKLSLILRKYWAVIWILMFSVIFLIYYFVKSIKGKKFLEHLILKTPFLNEFSQKIITTRFCHILAKLLNSGVVLLKALEIGEKTINHTLFKKEIILAQEKIQKGVNLYESLKTSKCIHPLGLQMIAIGESSGELDELLFKVGTKFDQEIDYTAERLPKLIEPILLVILGVIVGTIIIGVLMPMFSAINHLGDY